MTYKRVILKLSGEFLGPLDSGSKSSGFALVCDSIEQLVDIGVEPCVVVGGGNLFRGNCAERWGIGQVQGDTVGMMATGVNAALLAAMLDARGGVTAQVFSNGPCESLGRPWRAEDASIALSRGCVPVLAGGWGKPLVSTDYPAVGFAKEIEAEAVLMAKCGVDGVYDRDPKEGSGARFIPAISLAEALALDLRVMDRVAMQTAMEHNIVIHVFAAEDPELPARICKGEQIGTVLRP